MREQIETPVFANNRDKKTIPCLAPLLTMHTKEGILSPAFNPQLTNLNFPVSPESKFHGDKSSRSESRSRDKGGPRNYPPPRRIARSELTADFERFRRCGASMQSINVRERRMERKERERYGASFRPSHRLRACWRNRWIERQRTTGCRGVEHIFFRAS